MARRGTLNRFTEMTSEEFLRAWLRAPEAGGTRPRASIGDVDGGWESLREAIEAERVAPLLSRAADVEAFPPAVAEAFERSYRCAALRNLLLLREVGRCLRAFVSASVPVIVLKGVALAEAVYGNVALRPMGDVDLLVHRGDVVRARGVIEDLGYALLGVETHPGVLTEYENEVVFRKLARPTLYLDLHWSLFDSPHYQDSLPMDWFWETAQPLHLDGVPSLMLGPEALLIHLCGHLALHHASAGLLWWNDIARSVEAYGERIDWDQLIERAQQFNLLLPVRGVLTRAADEWRVPIPAAALQRMRSRQPSAEEQRVFAVLGAPAPAAGRRFWNDLRAMRSWWQRLRFARTNLVPSAAYMRQRYGVRHPLLLAVLLRLSLAARAAGSRNGRVKPVRRRGGHAQSYEGEPTHDVRSLRRADSRGCRYCGDLRRALGGRRFSQPGTTGRLSERARFLHRPGLLIAVWTKRDR